MQNIPLSFFIASAFFVKRHNILYEKFNWMEMCESCLSSRQYRKTSPSWMCSGYSLRRDMAWRAHRWSTGSCQPFMISNQVSQNFNFGSMRIQFRCKKSQLDAICAAVSQKMKKEKNQIFSILLESDYN